MAQEKQFESRIKQYLKDNGCWFVKFFANSFTKVGIPDILACVNGRFVGIEVKASNGRPSELQIWNKEQIRKCGGISIIVYPDQWEDFKLLIDDLLKSHDYKTIYSEQKYFDK